MDSLATTGTEMMDSMAQLLGDTELSSIFMRMMGTLLGILLSCAAIQTALATLRDETTGTLSLEVTSGGPRYRPLLVDWATAVLAGVATALAAAPLAALVTDWSMRSTYGDATYTSEIVRAAFWAVLDQLPPLIALAGFAILCVGLSTRLAPLAWTVLGISGVITYFGELFQFPDWLLNASVLAWAPIVERKYRNLTINPGCTLSVANPCQGLLLRVTDTLTLNGNIDMSAKAGAVPGGGADLFLHYSDIKIQRNGAQGGKTSGAPGADGTDGQGGGGGAGGIARFADKVSNFGAGADGFLSSGEQGGGGGCAGT